MSPLNRLTLRQRLLLWLLLPIVGLIAIWAWATYAIVLYFANLAHDRALEDTVQTLAGQVHIEQNRININLPPAAHRMLEFDQMDTVYFSVSDEHEQQLAGNHKLPPNPESSKTPEKTRFYSDTINGVNLRLAEYVIANEHNRGEIYVRVAETLNKRETLAREILIYVLAAQFLFLTGIVLLVWHGIGRGIAPLSRIRDAIALRTHEDLSPLDETGLPVEVCEQVRVINDLMMRLGRTITTQQRFIADATHQLRTPITVLRTQAELALRADAKDLHTFVIKLAAASARLSRLANQLLNLSRAEAGLTDTTKFTRFGVGEWVEDVVAEYVPAALDKHIEVSVSIADDMPAIRGNRQLLFEMLANLVDNAIRYTQADGKIEIVAQYADESVILIITDNGPGIPEAEREHVLERFYRGVEVSTEGSGLGLAIAQEILKLHGGRLTLAAAPQNTGLCVTVEIPAVTAV
ncbi:sensor histidine kinase [Nitrosomonas sp.]|uniref:sensor histidine kinase n=1 Tax=Nitrosomonas sp. TaxID=42353 RepID=UPI0025D9893A|nr:sensor histidine kinase [Nitrosomonas sp.]MCC6917012.1 sensor histidine kinase [Nitrosomonas sp.]